jgi:cystathionine beta-lyase/cystathionine gamma-synthase
MARPPAHLETRLVHAAGMASAFAGAKVTPIVRSTVFEARENESYGEIRYGRLSTLAGHVEVAGVLASIENGEAGLVTASGMAAISTTLLAVLSGGGHVLAQRPLYGATQHFVEDELVKLGGSSTPIDVRRPDGWSAQLTPQTRAIYVEAISNPLLDVADHRQVVAFARQHGLLSIIDNTFATPVNFRPLELGFDVVVHSATKYLNGHSDLCAGAIICSAEQMEPIRHWLNVLGGAADPETCFLLRRGLRTLTLRVERQNANAAQLASFLERHPAVTHVRYPGLERHADHGIASALFTGFGGMIACELAGGAEAAMRFARALRVATFSASLGGTETLVTIPAQTSHAGLSREARRESGIAEGLVRISMGIEHIDDLLADFEQALEGAVRVSPR